MTDLQKPALPPVESFAVVGYAVRVPGAADADEFWDVLREGRDAVSEVPADRWDVEEFFDPDPDAPGKIVARRAGFIDDATGFDAPFFGLSKRETMLIDPQHRLLLETAWRAVEHSGTAPSALANTKTGVFVGLGTHDYLAVDIGRVQLRRDRGVSGDRHIGCRRRGPDQLWAGAAGPGGHGRYRVQLVVGGNPPGVPGAALRGM